jgi:CubicO group peptidase (beta-lactamase class C family)
MRVEGSVASGFEPVRAAFAEGQALDRGGAQLCVYRNGERVVDLWAGRDIANDRPYTAETIAIMMSCTKAAVAACASILSERGQLDFEAPVARYWPEFAQAGKERVLVRHLLTHSAGLMGYEPESGIGARDMLDWQASTEALARMAPLWEPGSAYFYHFVTYGFLVGEVVRRVSGKTCGQFFSDEIARPLNIDMWIGLPEAQEARFAPHFASVPSMTDEQWRAMLGGLGVDLESRLVKTLLYTFATTEEFIHTVMKSRVARAIELPAGNGIGNARALAKMYAGLIGEVDGVRLIKRETMERARTPQTKGLGPPGDFAKFARGEQQWFGFGFELPRAPEPMFGPGSFGHAGAGGRMGFAQPEKGIAAGYVCNNMMWNNLDPDPRWMPWTKALHAVVS